MAHPKRFQFLGIPPKGEQKRITNLLQAPRFTQFPISRDPPEGGTAFAYIFPGKDLKPFPISRDPPEGGTFPNNSRVLPVPDFKGSFQFLGIPPKGERAMKFEPHWEIVPDCFQFLGIPPKGEHRGSQLLLELQQAVSNF